MTGPSPEPSKVPSIGVYWLLRGIESALLLAALAGIGLFAWSLVDIVRMGTGAIPGTHMPASAWQGVAVFVGALLLLQVVRVVLQSYRREDGTPLGDGRGAAAAVTSDVLAGLEDEAPSAGSSVDTGKV